MCPSKFYTEIDVFKLGGRAIAKHPDIIINVITNNQYPKVIIVSSIGQTAEIVEQLVKCSNPAASEYIKSIFEIYAEFIKKYISNKESKNYLETQARITIGKIAQRIAEKGKLEPIDKSYILTRGECLSALIIEQIFIENNLDAEVIRAEDIIATKGSFLNASIDEATTKENILQEILPKISRDKAIIIPGLTGYNKRFARLTKEKLVTYLGVDSGDITASVMATSLAGPLRKISVHFVKNTKGWQNADRSIVKNSINAPYITVEEISKAIGRHRLIHPKAIRNLLQHGIKTEMIGTVNNSTTRIVATRPNILEMPIIVVVGKEENVITLDNSQDPGPGYLEKIDKIIKKHGGSIDYEGGIGNTIIRSVDFNGDLKKENLDSLKKDLSKIVDRIDITKRSIIYLIGAGLKKDKKIISRAIDILIDNNINFIDQQSDGISLDFIIPRGQKKQAIQTLHKLFFTQSA